MKTWIVARYRIYQEDGGFKWALRIECPHCGNASIVTRAWRKTRKDWKGRVEGGGARNYIGRPCSYCFKTARLPEN